MSEGIGLGDRVVGGLTGLAIGDALGVPVEFESRAARAADPVEGMRSGGVWRTEAGTWSDDASLALCLAESIVLRGFDPEDSGKRSLAWLDQGLWSARGAVFDVGGATRRALDRIRSGMPAVMAGGRGENDNGNGSLMRILPASTWLAAMPEPARFRAIAAYSSTTHGHPRSVLGCWLHCLVVARLLGGDLPRDAYESAMEEARALIGGLPTAVRAEAGVYSRVLDGSLAKLRPGEVRGSGYVVHCLEASLQCLVSTGDFRSCVLAAVNLGEDADTTGAVAGGLAGIAYGRRGLPREWVSAIARADEIEALAGRLAALVAAPRPLSRSYWILPGKLLAGGYPDSEGGPEALLDAGIDAFLDLTAPGEALPEYGERLARAASARGRSVETARSPIADMSADREAVDRALRELDRFLDAGRSVYLHCLGGLGRTGTVVGSFLIERGLSPAEGAIGLVTALRSPTDSSSSPSPQTEEQRRLILSRRPGPGALPL
jgi:ADP-ribosyl-[dinitrogen reductase] hydrolase